MTSNLRDMNLVCTLKTFIPFFYFLKEAFIMKRIIKFLSILVMFFVLPFITANVACAITAEFESSTIPCRSSSYITNHDLVTFSINETNYEIPIGNAYDIQTIAFDYYGTLWINSEYDIFWTNYELEGENMSLHYFAEGSIVFKALDDQGLTFEKYVSQYGGPYFYYDLPTPDKLKELLYKEQNPSTPTPTPTQKPTPTPTMKPSSTPIPTKDPLKNQSPAPSANTLKTTSPQNTSDSKFNSNTIKFSKVKSSGSKIKLLNGFGKTVKTVTFKKKTGVLTYKKKRIKKVKDVYFTKKGSIVYLTRGKKAYYFNGKKSTLIKKNVKKVVTDSKRFATYLKLKNGKKFKLKK